MKAAVIIFGMSIFWTGFCRSQESCRVWTLRECMEYAVRNSSNVKRQDYTNDNYRQDHIAAVGNLLPAVSGSIGINRGFGRSINPETNTYANTSNFDNSYSLNGSIPLFRGLAVLNQIRSTRIARLRGDQELQLAKDDAALAVMKAFADVVYYTEAARIAMEQLDESHKNLYFTQKQAELGLKGRPDVAQFEAEAASFEHLLTRQQNLLNTALLQLKEQMNHPLGEPFVIVPEIPSHSGIFKESAEDIFFNALERLPQALIADYRLRESKLSLSVARGQYFPSISAYAGIGTSYFKNPQSENPTAAFGDQISNNLGKSIGVSVGIPLFSGLYQRTRVRKAENNLRIAKERYHENLRQLQMEIEQAVMDVEGYAQEYAQTVQKVAATEEAHRANQRRFEEGLISVLELQASTNLLLQSRVERLQAELQYRVGCRLLDYYKGEPLI